MAELVIDTIVKDADKAIESLKRVKKAAQEVEKSGKNVTKSNKSVDKSFKDVGKSIEQTRKKAMAFVAASLAIVGSINKITRTGFDYNQQMEDATQGLASLIAATSSNVSMMGKHLTAQEKLTMAQKESAGIMKNLEAINAQTPHTLSQTNEIFKTMYVDMKKANVSTKDMIEITKKLSIATGSAGVSFQSVIAGVDGLASGMVLANSDLGRFLSAIGLTNEELKNASNVSELLLEKLDGFQAVETYSVIMSNFGNAVNRASGAFTKGVFEGAKDTFKDLAEEISANTLQFEYFGFKTSNALSLVTNSVGLTVNAIQVTYRTFFSWLQMHLSAFFYKLKDVPKYGDKFKQIAIDLNSNSNILRDKVKGDIKDMKEQSIEYKEAIDALTISYEEWILKNAEAQRVTNSQNDKLQKMKDDLESLKIIDEINLNIQKILNPMDIEIDAINAKWDKMKLVLSEAKKSTIGLEKARQQELAEIRKKYQKVTISTSNESLKQQQSLLLDHYKRIGNMEKVREIELLNYTETVNKAFGINSKAAKQMISDYARLQKETAKLAKDNYLVGFYETLGKKDKVWAIKHKQLTKELTKHNIDLASKEAKEFLKVKKASYLKVEEVAKKSFDEINTYWDNITSSMGQSIEDNFFSYFERGFKDLRGMFKSLGKDLLANFTNPLYRGMSQSIASMLMPGYAGGGKTVASIAKSAGLSLVNGQWQGGGDTDGKPNIIMSSAGEVIQGKELIASMSGGNEILSSLSNLSSANSVLNFLSNPMKSVNGLTNFLSNPLSALQGINPLGSLASGIHGLTGGALGLTAATTSSGLISLAPTAGMSTMAGATPFVSYGANGSLVFGQSAAPATASSLVLTPAGYALVGGVAGFGVGSLGDKLFNAHTYAPITGGVGGAIGGFVGAGSSALSGAVGGAWAGPVGILAGAVLGSVLGSMFGKTKVIGSGIRVKDYLTADMTLGDDNIMGYVHKQKKGWFSKKDWKNLSSLDEATLRQIEGQIDGIAHLLESAGELRSFASSKGDFKGEDFYDVGLARGIIRSMITMPETISKEVAKKFGGTVTKGWFRDIVSVPSEAMDDARHEMFTQKISDTYKLWKDYAKSVDKSVFEAMRESLSSMVKTKRDFTEWTLKNDSEALAKFKANYLKKDAEAIAKSLGVNFASLTAENFLGKYNEAVSNTFDPNIINQWNSLSKAFQGATDAQEAYTNAVIQSSKNYYNAQINLTNAMGKDASKLRLELEKSMLYSWTLANATSNKERIKKMGMAAAVEGWKRSVQNMLNRGTLQEYLKTSTDLKSEWVNRIANLIRLEKQIAEQKQARTISYTPTTYGYTTPLSQYDYYTKYTPQAKLIEEAKKAVGIVGNVTRESLNERYKFFDGKSATSETISKMNSAFTLLEDSLKEVAKKLYTLDLNDRLTPFSTKLLSAKNALNITTLTTANLNTALKAVNNTSYKSQDALNEMNKHIQTLDKGLADLIQKAKKSFDELVNKVSQTAMSLSSVYSTSKGVIDKLRGDNSNFVKSQYAHFLKEARHYQDLVKKDIYDTKSASKFSEAVSNLSGYVDEYLNKDNFDTKHDYELQKSITANQFGEFQKTASVYDKLKEAVDEIKKVKEELKTQSDIQEEIVRLKRRVSGILEGIENGSINVGVKQA